MRRNSNRTFPDTPGLRPSAAGAGFGVQQSPQGLSAVADPRSDPRGFDAGAPIPRPVMPARRPCTQFAHGAGSFERPYQEPELGRGDWAGPA